MWVPFPPFVPSVYHPCFLLCIDQICVDWVHFFLFSFCFLQNMQKLAPFLCAFPLFAPLPTQIQIPGIWVKWLCQVSSELRQIPQHDGGFQRWPHFNPSALSHRGFLPSHPDSATLKFSSSSLPFPESCVVHVHSAGLNLHRSRLGFKMCTKMPGLTALGSKNCFVSSPGTLLSFFSFSYCHLWLWQPTLQSRLLFKF